MKQRRYRLDSFYDEDQYEMVPEMVEDDDGDWIRYKDVADSEHRQQLDAIVEQLRRIEHEMNESDESTEVDIATAIRLLERES